MYSSSRRPVADDPVFDTVRQDKATARVRPY